jgi:hypothetical protein
MTTTNYLVIENLVVTNVVMWDGNIETWTPPIDATMLVQSTTPAMLWMLDSATNTFILKEVMGMGDISFTWDGTVLTTNEPQPAPPKPQPAVTGLQTL